jgi:hypothetical protein
VRYTGRRDHETFWPELRTNRADEDFEFSVEHVEGVGMLSVKVRLVAVTWLHDTLEEREIVSIAPK